MNFFQHLLKPKEDTFRPPRVIPPIPESVWHNPWHFVAFGFGAGTLPIAPGTFGTLITIPFYLTVRSYSLALYLCMTIFIILACVWLSEKVSHEIKVHDHQGMCIDEFAGYFVTMIAAPHHYLAIIIGFLLFRLFDIWKPWPILDIDQHMKGGWGIVLDDVVAGIYACLLLHLIFIGITL